MIQGEGATVFILEDLQHALRRGAKIYAEIAGFSMSSDASDLMSPSFDGLVRAMKLAMDDAKFNLEDIDYINAHGTGTALNDKTESSAIKSLFGKKNSKYFVSSTKSMHGHLMGGSGAIELLACILALNKGVLAPTINFVKPDPFCDIKIVKNSAVENNAERVISNSFAFGGLNAVIALKGF